MRCTIKGCGHRLVFSFMDDVNQQNVYQCTAVGTAATISIPTDRGMNTYLVHTLDHSDVFYVRDGVELVQVKPVRLSAGQSKAIMMKLGIEPTKDKVTGKKVYPQAWGVRRA